MDVQIGVVRALREATNHMDGIYYSVGRDRLQMACIPGTLVIGALDQAGFQGM